jgi:hypothetical protein
MGLSYMYFFLSDDGYSFAGKTRHDGEDCLKFHVSHTITEDEAYEIAAGTTFHYTILLRSSDLLPVSMHSSVDTFPVATPHPPATAGPDFPSTTIEYTKVEFVDRSSLPDDFFDPDALDAMQMTPQEALAIAADQPFTTFWLGPSLDGVPIPGTNLTTKQLGVINVAGPGIPGIVKAPKGGISISYGLSPSEGPVFVTVSEAPATSFDPLSDDELDAMRAAGNVYPLESGEGYIYARYEPAHNCTFEQAQRGPDCRFAPGPIWSAIAERDGTRIQIVEAPKFTSGLQHDTNPFASEAAIRDLVGRLQPIPSDQSQ